MMGYIHVYTGDGKGKTTAAFGLALRAVGAGHKVFIAQFVKGMKYHELTAIERLSADITVKQYGRDCFIKQEPRMEDIRAAVAGLRDARAIMCTNRYNVVILDEANIATYYQLFSADALIDFIRHKPERVELVITGRRADPKIIAAADLVTEMKEIKHYYNKGIGARDGIEK